MTVLGTDLEGELKDEVEELEQELEKMHNDFNNLTQTSTATINTLETGLVESKKDLAMAQEETLEVKAAGEKAVKEVEIKKEKEKKQAVEVQKSVAKKELKTQQAISGDLVSMTNSLNKSVSSSIEVMAGMAATDDGSEEEEEEEEKGEGDGKVDYYATKAKADKARERWVRSSSHPLHSTTSHYTHSYHHHPSLTIHRSPTPHLIPPIAPLPSFSLRPLSGLSASDGSRRRQGRTTQRLA